jgi:hypothetical protein
MSDRKCACVHSDARACFLGRHPECRRLSDVPGPYDAYEATLDQDCECSCHDETDEDREWREEYFG